MVTDLVRYENVIKVAEEKGLPKSVINTLKSLEPDVMADKQKRKRQPRPPAPKGGITLSEAERKYGISHVNLSRWKKCGYLPVLLFTDWSVYVDESRVALLAEVYKKNPGRGSWAVKRFIENKNGL